MKRRTLLQWLAGAAAAGPMLEIPMAAAEDDLSRGDIGFLGDLAATLLPSGLGPQGHQAAVDRFVRWVRDYREGVPVLHGYGHPKLIRTGPSPLLSYARQIAALRRATRTRGGRFGALDLDVRRALVEEALLSAGVRTLPAIPDGTHIASDLMAHYFHSSAAADLCYRAHIGRNTYRTLQTTTVRPRPLAG